MQNVGIYRIQIGPYYYLGQSADLKKRKREHLNHLKRGTHHNKFMERVYKKYQEYEFKTMIECDIDQLNHLEQSALDIHVGYDDCMNICQYVESTTRGLKLSEEHKKKLSEAKRGKKHSEETKKKMSEAKKGVYVGDKHPQYNHTKYTFLHEQHGEVTCTPYKLYTKYNLDKRHLSKVTKGQYKQHKGWRLK